MEKETISQISCFYVRIAAIISMVLLMVLSTIVMVPSLHSLLDQQLSAMPLQDNGTIDIGSDTVSAEVLNNLGEIIVLPEESPSVAEIQDIKGLQNINQAVYEDAKNGDYLIIYKEKVIIYRKEENKIINVVNINLNPNIIE